MTQSNRVILRLIATGALLLPGWNCARPWGPEGHSIVAQIAQRQLEQGARDKLRELIGSVTLSSIASCADQVRSEEPRGVCLKVVEESKPESKEWHFIDIPIRFADLDMSRDCPDGNCVVPKIKEFARILRESRDAGERKEALMFLVHFVGDIHQPLHCADNNDRGGNETRVTFFGQSKKLHGIWDSTILDNIDDERLVNTLQRSITPQKKAEWEGKTVEQWADESHDQAVTVAYGKLPKRKPLKIADAYQDAAEPVVKEQLTKGGVRLGFLLNEALR